MIRMFVIFSALLLSTAGIIGMETEVAYADSILIETAGEEGKISVNSFLKLMREGKDSVYWIDNRDSSEINADGTFANTKAMTVRDLKKEIANLPIDKPIIFFCSTGARAGEAYDLVRLKRPELQVYFLDASVEFRKQTIPTISPPK